MDKGTESLLVEILAAVAGQYISDLHGIGRITDIIAKRLVFEIPDSRYSVAAWSEAAKYITGKPCKYSFVLDAKNAIAGG